MHQTMKASNLGDQLNSSQLTGVVACVGVRGGPSFHDVLTRSSAILTVVLGPKQLILASSSRWYPLFPTKVSGSLAHISMQSETMQVDMSQIEPYFEVMISNSYS